LLHRGFGRRRFGLSWDLFLELCLGFCLSSCLRLSTASCLSCGSGLGCGSGVSPGRRWRPLNHLLVALGRVHDDEARVGSGLAPCVDAHRDQDDGDDGT
jgi:hypothetical protein